MATRIVMADKDKDLIRTSLVDGFKKIGATEEAAVKAVTSGSVPMFMFVSKWICHNTDYPQTHEMTREQFFKGFYAWIHYKATAEKLEGKDMKC